MTPTDPIRAALERLVALADEDLLCPSNPAETDWGAVKSVLAEACAALAAKPPLTDEQIRNLAEFDFNFDRFNQVDQDKSENLAWECTDTQLIQFARFLISGGQKL